MRNLPSPIKERQQTDEIQAYKAEIARLTADKEGLENELIRYKESGAQIIRFANLLHTAADVSKQLSSILDLDRLLQEVITLVKNRFLLYHVHVYLLNEESQQLLMHVGSGEVGEQLRVRKHAIPLSIENSLVAKAARNRKIVLVDDVSQEPAFMPNPLLPDTLSEIAVPLIVGDKVLGVLDVQDDESHRFDQLDVDMFRTFSGHIATAMQNAYLFAEQKETEKELLRYASRLQSLNEIDKAILLSESPENIAKTAVLRLQAIIPYDLASISIFNAENNHSRIYAAVESEAHNSIIANYHIPDIINILEIAQGAPVYGNVADTFSSALPITRSLKEQGVKSVLLYPLLYRENLIGAINLASFQPDTFTENNVTIVDEIAAPLAIAIQQAHLYEEVKQHARALEARNKELEQFAYVASHDLQEPLRIVISYVQLLARKYQGQLDEDADLFIHYATDAALRMRTLISDLLDYSRLGTRGKPFAPVDMNKVVETVLRDLSLTITENEAAVTHDPMPIIIADDVQMGQLLQNLIGNAIKFRGSEAPHIHIGVTKQDNDYIFSVADNGIGIDPQYTDRIFAIFQRLHTVDEYPGTGIGLAVCKKIVERHNGQIWVESRLNEGTTMLFTIPVNA
jgi:signal transduction histidine kinase